MKEQELKDIISDSFIALAPNGLERLLEECAETKQCEGCGDKLPKRRNIFLSLFRGAIAIAVCVALFACGIMIGSYSFTDGVLGDTESVVYLDVNPSVEIKVDGQKRVVEVIAGNNDAIEVLEGLRLEGVEMNTAVTAVVGAMYLNGYFSDSTNSVLVSVDSCSDEQGEILLTNITEQINKVLGSAGIECSIIAQSLRVDDNLRERAQEQGVSVGKMHLVDRMIGGIEHLEQKDATELADMSIKELNLIYSTRPERNDGNDPFDKDISSGTVAGFIDEDEAVELAIEALELDSTQIEWVRVHAGPEGKGESRRMVYGILVGLKNNGGIYEAKVDCIDGKVEALGLKQTGEPTDNEQKENNIIKPDDNPEPTGQQGDKNGNYSEQDGVEMQGKPGDGTSLGDEDSEDTEQLPPKEPIGEQDREKNDKANETENPD
ncbi:MAG: hypothetical protein IJY24_00200 [Clostridia bacterium]|nr:hypothetical protein [Clostridia bacterium]